MVKEGNESGLLASEITSGTRRSTNLLEYRWDTLKKLQQASYWKASRRAHESMLDPWWYQEEPPAALGLDRLVLRRAWQCLQNQKRTDDLGHRQTIKGEIQQSDWRWRDQRWIHWGVQWHQKIAQAASGSTWRLFRWVQEHGTAENAPDQQVQKGQREEPTEEAEESREHDSCIQSIETHPGEEGPHAKYCRYARWRRLEYRYNREMQVQHLQAEQSCSRLDTEQVP